MAMSADLPIIFRMTSTTWTQQTLLNLRKERFFFERKLVLLSERQGWAYYEVDDKSRQIQDGHQDHSENVYKFIAGPGADIPESPKYQA